MKHHSAGARSAPRLNPFLFPADTDLRFVLLMAAVLGASLFSYQWLSNGLMGLLYWQEYYACMDPGLPYAPSPDVDLIEGFNAWTNEFDQIRRCLEPLELRQAAWVGGGLGALLLVAGALYWLGPQWTIWRDRLVPLHPEDSPELAAELGELCRVAGLRHAPTFLLDPLSAAVGGRAFGTGRRPFVALAGGLITHYLTDRPLFRAVVLHELAHVRNADIAKTGLTIAVWRAFVCITLAPFAISVIWNLLQGGDWHGLLTGVLIKVALLVAFVYLTRNAILRARELYADVRASAMPGVREHLERALSAVHSHTGPVPAALRTHLE